MFHWDQGFSSQFQLDGHSFSNFHWPLKDGKAIDWCKRISKLSLDKGNKLKEGHGSYQAKRHCVYERRGSGRKVVGSYVRKNQAWKECVQESSIRRMCVRIRHEKDLCSKYLLQSLWTLVLISCSSQIHRWICVKIESVLVWKV